MPYLLIMLMVLLQGQVAYAWPQDATLKTFAKQYAEQYGKDEASVLAILAQGQHQEAIIQTMQKPAEKALSWGEYRRIFIESKRLNQGLEFWQQHEALLNQLAQRYGVEPEIIVAILGIETRYGRVTGNYKVLDALMTLAFDYPPRAAFFTQQLAQFLLLSEQQRFVINEIKGSYAGAMGPAQFIASSYLNFAVDGDGDGHINILQDDADIIASVANYFARHGWKKGQLIALALPEQTIDSQWLAAMPNVEKARWTVGQYRKAGINIAAQIDNQSPANLIELTGAQGKQYWLCFDNFYVISRYNHSYLYSMAVFQFSQLLRLHKDMP